MPSGGRSSFAKFAKVTSTPDFGYIPNGGSCFLLLEQSGCQVILYREREILIARRIHIVFFLGLNHNTLIPIARIAVRGRSEFNTITFGTFRQSVPLVFFRIPLPLIFVFS